MKRLKRRLQEETTPAAATTTNWCFYERKHPHSLWHGDYLEKVTLHDTDQTAYQLTLQDDYSRAYVFCDLFTAPNVVTTIAALIAAMHTYQTIPRAVVFDNGQNFRGRLLQAFCHHLDIRLIHTAVHHPQTNGKLERAYRDDMREFYRQQPRWELAPLRWALPEYVHYRNNERGHLALGGRPARTRLQEQSWQALPAVLAHLESYAECEMRSRVVPGNGRFGFLGRPAYLSRRLAGRRVRVFETYYGLELRSADGRRYLLRDHRCYRQQYNTPRTDGLALPASFRFAPISDAEYPRIAGAL